MPEDPLELERVVVHRDRLAVLGCSENNWTDHFGPFYGKLADVALPYGDVTADKIGIGLAVATGAAIAGHAALKATRGKGEDGKKK